MSSAKGSSLSINISKCFCQNYVFNTFIQNQIHITFWVSTSGTSPYQVFQLFSAEEESLKVSSEERLLKN